MCRVNSSVPPLDYVYFNRDKGDHITLSVMREPCKSVEDYGGLTSGKVNIDLPTAPI